MASNPFSNSKAREAAKPKVSPRPTPKNPGVKPRGPDRRKPGTRPKDPRVPRVRPKPTTPKIVPKLPKVKPWHPGGTINFGKRQPYKFSPWLKKAPIPWGGIGGQLLIGGGLITFAYLKEEPDWEGALTAAGYQKCCGSGSGDVYYFMNRIVSWGCQSESISYCGITFQPYMGDWPTGLPATPDGYGARLLIGKKYGGEDPTNPGPEDRATWVGHWVRPHIPGNDTLPPVEIPEPVEKAIPLPTPTPVSPFEPLPPWSPEPWVVAPPVSPIAPWNPNPDPTPDLTPETAPYPFPGVVPIVGGPVVIPSITLDVDPGTGITIGTDPHRPTPPREPDKEKKTKPLVGKAAYAWLRALEAAGSSYMETDDFVSAIYKGLSWKVRRWRGRDGVWRDRDITTKSRLERIYSEFGQMNIMDAIKNVATQEAMDRAVGQIGNALSEAASRAGKAGYWKGAHGFQYGNNRKNDTWEEMYEAIKKEQGAKIGVRTYKVKYYDETLNRWYWVEKHRTDRTTIPWFRQESHHLGLARPGMGEYWDLTEQQKEDKVRTVRRWYYDEDNMGYNPIFFPDEN